MKKLLLTGLLMLGAASQCLYAVQARRDVVRTVTQPDGSTLQIGLRGDEFAHCFVTTDNVPVIQDKDGCWCFAMVTPEGEPCASMIPAADPEKRNSIQTAFVDAFNIELVGNAIFARALNAPRSRAKAAASQAESSKGVGLFEEVCFPSDGERHALVILLQYSDIKFTVNNAGDYFDRFLNEEGFSDNKATGSVRDFYIKGSGGNFTPHFDVYGPVTLSNRRSYYGGNDAWGSDLRPCQMVKEACEKLDDEINFADYDLDGDGYVDNVYVIYAGQGEADYGSAETIWPHRWSLSADGVSCTLDGKRIENYGCCNEWADERVAGIGTFCHEFGHVMGLPDLYATTYNNATKLTPGSWSVMDYGPYLNDGHTPPTFSAFERNALGWIDLKELGDAETVTLENIHDSNTACIIPTGDPNEFFLLENRQQTGWDKYLPGHGMLIWHIDYDTKTWNSNAVNNTANHQRVDIEEANGLSDNTDDNYMAGYTFPGTSRVTEFTANTKPALKTWDGNGVDMPITGITESTNGLITFDVCGGPQDLDTPVVTVSGVTCSSFVLTWEAVRGAEAYEVNVVDGDNAPLRGFPATTDKATYTVNYLQPLTKYSATVRAIKGSNTSEASEAVEATTTEFEFATAFPAAQAATNVTLDGFTANWNAIDGAVDYRLTVLSTQPVAGETATCEFGTTKYVTTAGWSTTADGVYESQDYVGESSPSLKLAKHGLYLLSPVFDKDLMEIKFWYRGAGAHASNYLEVEVRADEDSDWKLVRTVQPLIISKGGETIKVTDIPAGMRQMRLVYYKPNNGNVAIDDVCLTLGGSAMTFHKDYNEKSVGNVMSHDVDATSASRAAADSDDADVIMYYNVRGVNALGVASGSSPLITVNLSNGSSVSPSEIAVPAEEDVVFYDLEGRRVDGQPAAGIYLMRQGAKVTKVIVK